MTEFSIYQINTDRDDNRVCFLGLDTLERFQHSKEVDPALYDRIYDGKLDCNSLEAIYEKFNIDHLLQNRNSRLISFENQAAMYVVYSVVKTRRRMQSGGINSYLYYP